MLSSVPKLKLEPFELKAKIDDRITVNIFWVPSSQLGIDC
jgi:hypothetical protein